MPRQETSVHTPAATQSAPPTDVTPALWEYDQSIVGNDYFSPYVTQVGLYNDTGELLLVAKLSQAIKIPNDKDLTFVVKFDT